MRAYVTLLLTLAAIWGSSYMFVEIALRDLEPTTLMSGRLVIASVFLVGLMAARGILRRLGRAGWRAFALGLINSAVPFTLIAWGQKHIDSGVAAIANATVPLFVAILAIWLAHSERATGLRVVGIVLGLVGVGVLTGAQPEVDSWAVIGTLAVVAASVSYALAGLLLQRQTERIDALTLSTATILGATLALLPFGLLQAPSDLPGWEASAAVLALGIAGTGVGILLFMKMLGDFGAFRAGLVTYLMPVTALLYGSLLLDETVTLWMLVGMGLVLSRRCARLRAAAAEPDRRGDRARTTVSVTIRRASPDDVDFLVELTRHDDVDPFLSARRATTREELLEEIERSAARAGRLRALHRRARRRPGRGDGLRGREQAQPRREARRSRDPP